MTIDNNRQSLRTLCEEAETATTELLRLADTTERGAAKTIVDTVNDFFRRQKQMLAALPHDAATQVETACKNAGDRIERHDAVTARVGPGVHVAEQHKDTVVQAITQHIRLFGKLGTVLADDAFWAFIAEQDMET
ncbi:MAG: hypothetical protein V1926_00390 [Candidatus Peregrinibacteria bacterium]